MDEHGPPTKSTKFGSKTTKLEYSLGKKHLEIISKVSESRLTRAAVSQVRFWIRPQKDLKRITKLPSLNEEQFGLFLKVVWILFKIYLKYYVPKETSTCSKRYTTFANESQVFGHVSLLDRTAFRFYLRFPLVLDLEDNSVMKNYSHMLRIRPISLLDSGKTLIDQSTRSRDLWSRLETWKWHELS